MSRLFFAFKHRLESIIRFVFDLNYCFEINTEYQHESNRNNKR